MNFEKVTLLLIFLFSTTLGISYNSFTQTGTTNQWIQIGAEIGVFLGSISSSSQLELIFNVPPSLATSFNTTFSFKILRDNDWANAVIQVNLFYKKNNFSPIY